MIKKCYECGKKISWYEGIAGIDDKGNNICKDCAKKLIQKHKKKRKKGKDKPNKIHDFFLGLIVTFISVYILLFLGIFLDFILHKIFGKYVIHEGILSFFLIGFFLIFGSIHFYRKKRYYILVGATLSILILILGSLWVRHLFSRICC